MADKRSFEEQVRDELAGFSIEPEEQVWEEVNKNLNKSKRRRWIVWFFLFAVAGSIGAYLAYVGGIDGNKPLQVVSTKEEKKIQNHNFRKQSAGENPIQQNLSAPKTATSQDHKPAPPLATESYRGYDHQSIAKSKQRNLLKNNQDESAQTTIQNKTDELIVSAEQKQNSVDIAPQPKTETAAITLEKHDEAERSNAEPAKDLIPAGKNTGGAKRVGIDISDSADQIAQASTKNVNSKQAKKQLWKFGIGVDLGKNYLSASIGPFSLLSQSSPLFFLNYNSSSSASASAQTQYYDSRPRPGYSFSITGEATRELSKRWSFTGSLGYQLFTSKINVGAKTDTAIGNGAYYLATNEHVYTNDYHFLKAGLAFNRQFRFGKAFTVRWNIGMDINWLFASDALQFHVPDRWLYVDNSNINRMQTSLSTGLDFGIGKKPLLFFGPEINYFVTEYDLTNLYGGRRFAWLGFKTHIPLGKR